MVGLKGKVALVTGATRGIGRAIAIHLAGAKVIIDHPGQDALAKEVVSEIRQKGQEAIVIHEKSGAHGSNTVLTVLGHSSFGSEWPVYQRFK